MMLVFWRKRPIELANPWGHRQRHHRHHPSPAPEVKAETKLRAKVGRLCLWIRLGLDFLYQVYRRENQDEWS
jgi:hypothetical protein